jgi:hypothetical protein
VGVEFRGDPLDDKVLALPSRPEKVQFTGCQASATADGTRIDVHNPPQSRFEGDQGIIKASLFSSEILRLDEWGSQGYGLKATRLIGESTNWESLILFREEGLGDLEVEGREEVRRHIFWGLAGEACLGGSLANQATGRCLRSAL